jgi:hypothetical protein
MLDGGQKSVAHPTTWLDDAAIYSFIFGVLLLSAIGTLTAAHSYKEHKMAEDKVPTNQFKSFVGDSVNGIKNMEPGVTIKKSVDGISKMNPKPTQPITPTSEKKK